MSYSSGEKRTCPCKRLPRCLSSFTAAEYGDLCALDRLGPSVANKRDANGYTPLHLAAQNGHVAATCHLLRLGAHVDAKECGATPLHRASYAGAVSTMKILLEWNRHEQCDVLAKDVSFGDNMTPLHKAAAGGRYLAVQLLLDTLRSRDNENRTNVGDQTSLFCRGLRALDAAGRTPLEVAASLYGNQKEEQMSVRRWDAVAGGTADWGKCVELLRTAEKELSNDDASTLKTDPKSQTSALGSLPKHLAPNSSVSCLDCNADDGQCLTASWESAFQSVLSVSVTKTLSVQRPQSTGDHSMVQMRDPQQERPTPIEHPTDDKKAQYLVKQASFEHKENETPIGQECSSCGVRCFALCRGKDGTLVCRNCSDCLRRKKN